MYASEYKNTRGMTPLVSNAKIFVNRNPLQTVTQHVTDYYDLSMNGKPATTFYETTRKQASTLSTMRDIELETTENLKDAVKSKSHLFLTPDVAFFKLQSKLRSFQPYQTSMKDYEYEMHETRLPGGEVIEQACIDPPQSRISSATGEKREQILRDH
jgi:hypothetical protein